jgi:hypothetical protein
MWRIDALTFASTVFTCFGMFTLFLSSKPVTIGGVLMTICVSLAATQTAMGLERAFPAEGDRALPSREETGDLSNLARSAWQWGWSQAEQFGQKQ